MQYFFVFHTIIFSSLLQHHNPKLPRYFRSIFTGVPVSAPYGAVLQIIFLKNIISLETIYRASFAETSPLYLVGDIISVSSENSALNPKIKDNISPKKEIL